MVENSPIAARAAAPLSNEPPKHSGSFSAVWIVLGLALVAAAIAAFVIYKHGKKPPARVAPPTSVSTTNAVKGSIDEFVWGLGTVTPVYTAWISPRVDGQILKVNYTEGQMVTTNDLLAEIDPSPYQALALQAEGQLARDKAQMEGANVDLDRFRLAFEKKAVPKQQVDDQIALVHQYGGAVKVDEGQVSNATVQLAYCYIHAPINGRTGLRMIDPGNIVHAANTNALVVVAQLRPITVVFSVGEDYLPAIQRQLQAGHPMTVEAWDHAQKQKLATGKFLTMDNMIATSTGTIAIKAMFENNDLELYPNQFVNPKLIIDTVSNATLIPTAAIQLNPQGAFVYVVTNREVTLTNQSGTVTTNESFVNMRPITEIVSHEDVTSVDGLAPGEVIATDNFNKLGDGAQVRVRQPGGGQRRGGGGGGGEAGQGKHGGKNGGNKDKAPKDQP
ncbi:MAG TPA: efflux RND transporter periplasmic adaptor subunit [Verrucomicrobiae bacterium]|jgi:multidrug efflux system membrane fusion protein